MSSSSFSISQTAFRAPFSSEGESKLSVETSSSSTSLSCRIISLGENIFLQAFRNAAMPSFLSKQAVIVKQPYVYLRDWIIDEDASSPENEELYYNPEILLGSYDIDTRNRALIWCRLKTIAKDLEIYLDLAKLSQVSTSMKKTIEPSKVYKRNELLNVIYILQSQPGLLYRPESQGTKPGRIFQRLIESGHYITIVKFFVFFRPEAIWNNSTSWTSSSTSASFNNRLQTLCHAAVYPIDSLAFSPSLIMHLLTCIKKANMHILLFQRLDSRNVLQRLEGFESNMIAYGYTDCGKGEIDREKSIELVLKEQVSIINARFYSKMKADILNIKIVIKKLMLEAVQNAQASQKESMQLRSSSHVMLAGATSLSDYIIENAFHAVNTDFTRCISKTFGDVENPELILKENASEAKYLKILGSAHEELELMQYQLAAAHQRKNPESIKKDHIDKIVDLVHSIQHQEIAGEDPLGGAKFLCKAISHGLYHEVLKIYVKAIPGAINNRGLSLFNALINPKIDQYVIDFLIELLEIIQANGLPLNLNADCRAKLNEYLAARTENQPIFKSLCEQVKIQQQQTTCLDERVALQHKADDFQDLVDRIDKIKKLVSMLSTL